MSGPIIVALLLLAGYAVIRYHQTVRNFFRKNPSTPAAQTPPHTSTKGRWKGTDGKLTSSAKTVLLSIIGLVALSLAYFSQVDLADVARFGADNTLLVVILAGVIVGLTALNNKELGAAAVPLRRLVGATAFVMMFGMPLADWYNSPSTSVARATTSTASATSQGRKMSGTLTMPPNGDSEPLSVPSGCAPYYTGNEFTIHCLYTDGRRGIVGDPIHPCGDGPMVHSYVRDLSGKPNQVSYEIVCR